MPYERICRGILAPDLLVTGLDNRSSRGRPCLARGLPKLPSNVCKVHAARQIQRCNGGHPLLRQTDSLTAMDTDQEQTGDNRFSIP